MIYRTQGTFEEEVTIFVIALVGDKYQVCI